jgi:hypothetical protein
VPVARGSGAVYDILAIINVRYIFKSYTGGQIQVGVVTIENLRRTAPKLTSVQLQGVVGVGDLRNRLYWSQGKGG